METVHYPIESQDLRYYPEITPGSLALGVDRPQSADIRPLGQYAFGQSISYAEAMSSDAEMDATPDPRLVRGIGRVASGVTTGVTNEAGYAVTEVIVGLTFGADLDAARNIENSRRAQLAKRAGGYALAA